MKNIYEKSRWSAGRNIVMSMAFGLTLSGCYSGFGAGYADAGYDSYGCDPYDPYDSYYDCDYGHGFANIGYGGGWYDSYYYPGYGVFIFDSYGKRYPMRQNHRHYWGKQRNSWQRSHHRKNYQGKNYQGRDHYRNGGSGRHGDDRSGWSGHGRNNQAVAQPEGPNVSAPPPARQERQARTPRRDRQAVTEGQTERKVRAGTGRPVRNERRQERQYRNIRNQTGAAAERTGNRASRARQEAEPAPRAQRRSGGGESRPARAVKPRNEPPVAKVQNDVNAKAAAPKARPAPAKRPGRREGARTRGGLRTRVQDK